LRTESSSWLLPGLLLRDFHHHWSSSLSWSWVSTTSIPCLNQIWNDQLLAERIVTFEQVIAHCEFIDISVFLFYVTQSESLVIVCLTVFKLSLELKQSQFLLQTVALGKDWNWLDHHFN
jgi:hypothetical protein